MGERRFQAILLPGGVLPAELAYPALVDALGADADVRYKELEVYATDDPPEGNPIELEVDGIRAFADAAGFERFHLVGYSAGGASALAFCAAHPDRLLSLALNEPAWIGNAGQTPAERAVWREAERIMSLPPEEMMPAFARMQLAPGVEPPAPPPGPPPPWMAKRPPALSAFMQRFRTHDIDHSALRAFSRPVLYTVGGRSGSYYRDMADRLAAVFPDFTIETFPDRHHFDPPHRTEPERFAAILRALWERASDRA